MNDYNEAKLKITLGNRILYERNINFSIPKATLKTGEITDGRTALGLAGEFLIAGKLVDFGLKVVKLGNSSPVDLLVSDAHIPVEVKVASKGYSKARTKNKQYSTECYAFYLQNKFSFFVIIWLVDLNECYIVPSSLLKIGVNRIYPNGKRWQRYKENWNLLKTAKIVTS